MREAFTIEKTGKTLRCGFTTGSCAAAAAKAALIMLLERKECRTVAIRTIKGPIFHAGIEDIRREDGRVSCGVRKDAGDDPDSTNGMLISAEVSFIDGEEIVIEGGRGVGKVTKRGLDQPVGAAAINSVPRRMITEALSEVLDTHGRKGTGLLVTISAEGGEEIAKKTFNPRLGIVGGISILGSTGIVEPMSDEALKETIRREIMVRREQGEEILVIVPGNYGLSFLRERFGLGEDRMVLSSNFAYDAVWMGVSEGFQKILFAGHLGKLVKLASGIKNTHSAYGDHRMEILSEASGKAGAGAAVLKELSLCVTTEEAAGLLKKAGVWEMAAEELIRRIRKTLFTWTEGRAETETLFFVKEDGLFAASEEALEWLAELKEEEK